MKIAAKVIGVTGAGSGMGRRVALKALRRGAKVAAVDVSESTLAETGALANRADRLSTHVVNITDRAAVAALPGAVIERWGAVDGLVHCAGIIQPFVRLKDLDDAAIERVFAVNWWGTLYLTKTFLPILLGRPEGHIVTSVAWAASCLSPARRSTGSERQSSLVSTKGTSEWRWPGERDRFRSDFSLTYESRVAGKRLACGRSRGCPRQRSVDPLGS